jgi:hypothetical protein
MVLCTDIYMLVQGLISAVDPKIIPKDYDYLWKCKNQNPGGQSRIREWLSHSMFDTKKNRDRISSFFRSDTETEVVLDWLTQDMFWSRRAKHEEALTKMPVVGSEEVVYGISQWDWTRNNPSLAGLIAFVVTQAVNDLGMVMQNDNGATLAYAHLYNYLRQSHTGDPSNPTSVVEEEWTDMESLFKLVGDASIFKGERPKAIESCYSRILLWHGTSLSDPSKTARSNKAKVWSQGTLKFAKVPLVDEIFEAGIKQQNFLNILNKNIQALILREVNLHARGCGSSSGERKFAKTQDIGGYLSLFRHTLQYEIPKLHFHHMNLALRSRVFNKELLRTLVLLLKRLGFHTG